MLEHWLKRLHASYPLDTAGFLRTVTDQFANPVGHVTRASAKVLVTAICGDDVPEEALRQALEDLIRIRAVQPFAPEQAAGVIFFLKGSIRAVLGSRLDSVALYKELLDVEARIDSLALMAFGMYSAFRERLHNQRVEEFKRAHASLFRLAEQGTGAPRKKDG